MPKFPLFSLCITLLFVLPVDEAFARKARVLGCSASDLNGYGASMCVSRGERDILNGSGSVHVAVCSGGKTYCCITRDGVGSGHCVDVTDRLGTRGGGFTPSGGSGRSGGTNAPTNGGGGCPGGVC